MKLFRMLGFAYWAFVSQRFKKHGKAQSTRIAFVGAWNAFCVGMSWYDWRNPFYWILKGYDVAGVKK